MDFVFVSLPVLFSFFSALNLLKKHHAGEQETHWDKINKDLTASGSKMVIFFVCLAPARFLLTSKVSYSKL